MRWVLLPDPGSLADTWGEALHISPVTAAILAQRVGTEDLDDARAFLQPSLSHLHSPMDMVGMPAAARRIVSAIRAKERILVFGDYDTDGVTACAVLLRILRILGSEASSYLPCRLEEGYGLSTQFVEHVKAGQIDLVITVDCGTSDHDAIRSLVDAGIDVIVTDHHEPGDQPLPDATVVVNPKRVDSTYPFRDLVGVGIAFKLAWAVCEEFMGQPRVGDRLQQTLLSLLPIVAVGTVADVAPLVGENRILVRYGLRACAQASAGLQALLDVCRVDPQTITVRDIGFVVAPRINAAGRLGNADLALQLLVEEDPAAAAALARELDTINTERQSLCHQTMQDAIRTVNETHDLETTSAIVIAGDNWHEGVIGIVAGRLSDTYRRPVAVIALANGKGKGSARSVPGLNLYDAISRSRHRMLTFGGHEQAAGFSIPREEIAAFREELNHHCATQIASRRIEPRLHIDRALDLGDLQPALLRELEMLAPFGEANPRPIFLCKRVKVVGHPRLIGKEKKHFSFNASQKGTAYRAVVFNHIEWVHEIDRGVRMWDIVFQTAMNDFYTPPRLELHIQDMRPSDR